MESNKVFFRGSIDDGIGGNGRNPWYEVDRWIEDVSEMEP